VFYKVPAFTISGQVFHTVPSDFETKYESNNVHSQIEFIPEPEEQNYGSVPRKNMAWHSRDVSNH
jgi:hypothetical protein